MSETRFTVDVDGVDSVIQKLLDIAPMFQGKKGFPGNPLRNAVRAGAVPIEELAKAKARALGDVDAAWGGSTGNLADSIMKSIVSVKDRDPFTRKGDTLEGYLIGYRRKQAAYGGWVELGTDKMSAQPYLRPALQEGGKDAVKAFREKLSKDLARIEKKLAAQK